MKRIALLSLLVSSLATAADEPTFYLCSDYVQRSAVGEQNDQGWPVFIELTASGASSFETFSEANAGRTARVMAGSREFTRATMWVPVSGGRLHTLFPSAAVATEWQQLLTTDLPAAPCGAGK